MSLRSRLRDVLGDDALSRPTAGPFSGTDGHGTPVVQFSPGAVESVRLFSESASLGALYGKHWAVQTVVNYLAWNIAQLNVKVYRRGPDGEREPAQDSPLAVLLNRPNDHTSRFDLIRGTVSDLAIYDNAYWLKRFIGNARQLFRIPPEFVQIVGGDIIRGPGAYRIDANNGNGAAEFKPSEVVHIHGFNALDTRVGYSPLVSLKSLLAEEFQASRHRAGYWANAARREGIIERPLDAPILDEVGMKRLREGMSGEDAGAANAGKTKVIEEGGHWVDSSFSPRDSEFIPGRQFVFDTVATAYNIPLALLSRSSTPTFASMKEFHKALYVDVLGPWNAMIEQALWLQLIPDFNEDGLYVEMNIEEKLQGDFESQADALRSHVQVPDTSVNDALRIQNREPYGDPNDPANPFNWPAKPSNYTYQGEEPAPAVQQAFPAAAMNGHKDEIAVLEAILEDR